jgi:hypothetical protein
MQRKPLILSRLKNGFGHISAPCPVTLPAAGGRGNPAGKSGKSPGEIFLTETYGIGLIFAGKFPTKFPAS